MSINWGFFQSSLGNVVGLVGLALLVILIFQARGAKIAKAVTTLAFVGIGLVTYGLVVGYDTTAPALTSAILNTGTTTP